MFECNNNQRLIREQSMTSENDILNKNGKNKKFVDNFQMNWFREK